MSTTAGQRRYLVSRGDDEPLGNGSETERSAFQHGFEVGHGKRTAVQVALRLVAAQVRECFELIRRLHALGHGRHVESLAERDDGLRDGAARATAAEATHER